MVFGGVLGEISADSECSGRSDSKTRPLTEDSVGSIKIRLPRSLVVIVNSASDSVSG